MRALITGITGQDGSYLAELLLSKGYHVFGMVRRTSTPNTQRIAHILDNITLLEGDMTDHVSLESALDRSQPDEVYNLAAMSHVGSSFKQPFATFDINLNGVLRLLELIRFRSDIKLYQASTSEMFGNNPVLPLSEESEFHPVSPYAIAKTAAHQLVSQYRDAYGLFACSGILFNHESPRRGDQFVTRKITKAIGEIKAGRQTKLELGNITAYRDWGYAGDYVEAMWLMLQQEKPDDYVIATGVSHSVEDFVELAFDCAGLDWRKYVIINDSLRRPTDVERLRGDARKAQRRLGWCAKTSFFDLVKMMVDADCNKES